MKRIIKLCIILAGLILIFSCDQKLEKEKVEPEKKKIEEKVLIPDVKTGWKDKDTYTVKVIAKDRFAAIDMAKHRILKDIIKVRYKIYGKYSSIAKIKDEFNRPLRDGIVISKRDLPNGIELFFQIRDKDLKKKFEIGK